MICVLVHSMLSRLIQVTAGTGTLPFHSWVIVQGTHLPRFIWEWTPELSPPFQCREWCCTKYKVETCPLPASILPLFSPVLSNCVCVNTCGGQRLASSIFLNSAPPLKKKKKNIEYRFLCADTCMPGHTCKAWRRTLVVGSSFILSR